MSLPEYECVICGSKHKVDGSPDSESIPGVNGGVLCRTTGNYGSTEYDVFYGFEFVEFIICDECFIKKAKILQRITLKELEGDDKVRSIALSESYDAYVNRIKAMRESKAMRKANES